MKKSGLQKPLSQHTATEGHGVEVSFLRSRPARQDGVLVLLGVMWVVENRSRRRRGCEFGSMLTEVRWEFRFLLAPVTVALRCIGCFLTRGQPAWEDVGGQMENATGLCDLGMTVTIVTWCGRRSWRVVTVMAPFTDLGWERVHSWIGVSND